MSAFDCQYRYASPLWILTNLILSFFSPGPAIDRTSAPLSVSAVVIAANKPLCSQNDQVLNHLREAMSVQLRSGPTQYEEISRRQSHGTRCSTYTNVQLERSIPHVISLVAIVSNSPYRVTDEPQLIPQPPNTNQRLQVAHPVSFISCNTTTSDSDKDHPSFKEPQSWPATPKETKKNYPHAESRTNTPVPTLTS